MINLEACDLLYMLSAGDTGGVVVHFEQPSVWVVAGMGPVPPVAQLRLMSTNFWSRNDIYIQIL